MRTSLQITLKLQPNQDPKEKLPKRSIPQNNVFYTLDEPSPMPPSVWDTSASEGHNPDGTFKCQFMDENDKIQVQHIQAWTFKTINHTTPGDCRGCRILFASLQQQILTKGGAKLTLDIGGLLMEMAADAQGKVSLRPVK